MTAHYILALAIRAAKFLANGMERCRDCGAINFDGMARCEKHRGWYLIEANGNIRRVI